MSNDDRPLEGTESVLPTPTPKVNKGGPAYHKAGCRCNPCKARRRKAKALAFTAGDGGDGMVPETEEAIIETLSVVKTTGAKARVAQWYNLRSLEPDLNNTEIAARIGISKSVLQAHIRTGVQQGWLKFDDPLDQIEHEIIPQVVKNLHKFLREEGDGTRDTTNVTLEVAKGTVIKQFQESKGVGESKTTVLALKVEYPDFGPDVKVVSGHVVGKPKQIE